jgi:GTP-binding protein HflX
LRRHRAQVETFIAPEHDERLTAPPEERGFLVAADVRSARPLLRAQESLDELALLAKTAGIQVVGRAVQHLQRIDPATYIGSGKVREVQEQVAQLAADVVIFDDELSPNHQRELEKRFGETVKVIDRSALDPRYLRAARAHARRRAAS